MSAKRRHASALIRYWAGLSNTGTPQRAAPGSPYPNAKKDRPQFSRKQPVASPDWPHRAMAQSPKHLVSAFDPHIVRHTGSRYPHQLSKWRVRPAGATRARGKGIAIATPRTSRRDVRELTALVWQFYGLVVLGAGFILPCSCL
jgi:hypothetical protein